jgi:hypothetical protein
MCERFQFPRFHPKRANLERLEQDPMGTSDLARKSDPAERGNGEPSRRRPETATPIGGAVSGRSQTFADSTSKCLPGRSIGGFSS